VLRVERDPYTISVKPIVVQIYMPPIVWKGDCMGHIGINDTFFYVVEGECFLHIDQETSIIRPGQLAYLPKGKKRTYTHTSGRFEMYEVGFAATADGISLTETLGLTERDFVVDICEEDRQRIRDMFRRSNKVQMFIDPLHEVEWSVNILEMIRIYTLAHRATEGSERKVLEPALRFISDNLSSPITTEMLAESVHMQPTYFIRKFKRIMGITPQSYIGKLRLYRAMGLLLSADIRIEAVSKAVGMEDPSYFSRFFKKHSGVTPGEYRRAFGR